MIFLLVAGIGVLAAIVYLVFVMNEVPELSRERLGALEPLPEDLGRWRVDHTSEAGRAATARGEQREEREILDERTGELIHQVRYRDLTGDVILRVERETRRKRRRIRG